MRTRKLFYFCLRKISIMSPTIVLLVLNIGASLYAWNNQDVYRKWMMNPYKVNTDNQYYRFITSGFIHGDWMHLIFNMLALYSFGNNLEYYLHVLKGNEYQLYYYGLYLAALVISELPTYLKHRNDSGYNSLGASGAVSAVVFACIVVSPLSWLSFFFIPMPAFIFGFVYLAYSYYASKKSLGGINHDAHFYGAVFGVATIIFIHPPALAGFFEQISNWSLFH
jgi:membrane associated rhomboid family serine protease